TTDIWLRREFSLPDRSLNDPHLVVHYDEAPEIYFNGVLAAKLTGWSTSYGEVPISPAALAALRPGKNFMAVHASQTYGGQYIDAGIVEQAKASPVRMLFNYPVRDTCICLAPDGNYYLSGTTGFPDWWKTNEGIRIWQSRDLTNWMPLGLVWSFAKDATWQRPVKDGCRAIWAPEIHYLKGTFWISYCVNWPGGGTGLLRSQTGKAEGPYVDVKPDGPLTSEIDASLFQDDDGQVY
ncbi:MAG: family 43 glycosylhydrolase, partial [Candidatus Omnitrophica bacterium]|nr:family 43 glycosylhydrolase [Candidatus Omnitrophota bacterium]